MTHPYIEGQKVTYSNSLLKPWIEWKYAIKLIPVKSYKKATAFISYGKVTGRYHIPFPKPSKSLFKIAIPFKANASLCSNASQYSGFVKACKKLASSMKKGGRKTVKFIICVNCKVLIKSAVNV